MPQFPLPPAQTLPFRRQANESRDLHLSLIQQTTVITAASK
jgi:hypothetical protein